MPAQYNKSHKETRQSVRFLIVISITLFSLSACAGTKPPAQKLASAETTIRQAEQVDARRFAPLQLREAKQKLEKARQLVKNEDYERAGRLAERAKVDAELAAVTARSAKAQKAVQELQESIRLLRKEIARNRGYD